MIYPDFDNYEIKNENDEWQKLFQFRLDECKLEDFSEQVTKVSGMQFYCLIQCAKFQYDREEFITSNSFVCSNGKTEVCGNHDQRHGQYACPPNSDQIVTRIQSHSNIYFQYNGSVYPYHIFLNCKTKLQTILISATRKEFEIGTKNLVVSTSIFQNLTRRVHLYTQFDNKLDIYNDIVANGINPDSSSWDLRKTFELMKDPREEQK